MAERNELLEHLKTFVILLETEADDHRATSKLWAEKPEEYGTDAEGVIRWAGKGEGIQFAADQLRKRFGL